MQLIMPVCVEAARIAARAIPQGAAALRVSLGGRRLTDKAKGGHTGERSSGGDEEFTTGKFTLSTCSLSDHP